MNKERERAILQILVERKKVTTKELSAALYASEPSIRRDLCELEKKRLLRRVHGGAQIDESALSDIKLPFLLREIESRDEKIKIAGRAAELVHDGDTVFLDASTSAYSILPFLAEKSDLIVITNGIRALTYLGEANINCIGTGGEVMNSCLAFVGEDACRSVEKYNADICFFSCRGLSDDGRLTDISKQENEVRIRMIGRSERAYMLCTADKKGRLFYHTICRKEDIDGVITTQVL